MRFQFIAMFVVFNVVGLVGYAQDIHFSQYLSAPFNLNPALTGNFSGDYRLTGNYRNQWNSVTVPYQTYGIGGDMNSVFGVRNLGAGAAIYYDRAGDSRYSTFIVETPFSYSYPITRDSSHKIHAGIMPGFVRQELNYGNLYFDNQYNNQTGQYDPGLSSGESYGVNSINYFNLAAGLRYSFDIAPRHKMEAGFSVYNMLEPSNSQKADGNANVSRRFNLHGNYQFKLIEKIDLLPGALYTAQSQSSELVLGCSGRYLYNGYTAFHLGYWYRNSDAGFASAGITYQTLYIGLSYDINTSKLKEASRGRGAFELSVVYVFRKFKPNRGKYLTCPNYL